MSAPGRVSWRDNDALFRELLGSGYAWQYLPFAFLLLSGLDVEMPALTVRADISTAARWNGTYDLIANGERLEVKSRPFAFTSPRDWPRDKNPAFLDTVKKWSAQSVKPIAYIFVSRATGGMVATCALESAAHRWGRLRCKDTVRNIEEEFFTVDKAHLVTMDRLVAVLSGRAAG